MRVGIASECPWVPSSFGKVVHLLARGLIEEGFDVKVFCPTAPHPTLFSRSFIYKVSCDMGDLCPSGGMEVEVRGYLSFADSDDIDVVLVFGTPYGGVEFQALEECSRLSKPCAGYFVTESMLLPISMSAWVTKVSYFASPSAFSRGVFIDSLAKYSPDMGREAQERSTVVYHGIDLGFYDPSNCCKVMGYTTWSRSHNAYLEAIRDIRSKGKRIIGFMAKNNPRKDVAALIEAVSGIDDVVVFPLVIEAVSSNTWQDVFILASMFMSTKDIQEKLVVGDPMAKQLGVTEYSVLKLLCTYDVFVYPTSGESFGIPPIEALAVGTPVVVTDLPVTREILSGYDGNLFVRSYRNTYPPAYVLADPDPGDLSRAIRYALDNREAISRGARDIALKYDYRSMVNGIIRVLERAEEWFRERRTNNWWR